MKGFKKIDIYTDSINDRMHTGDERVTQDFFSHTVNEPCILKEINFPWIMKEAFSTTSYCKHI